MLYAGVDKYAGAASYARKQLQVTRAGRAQKEIPKYYIFTFWINEKLWK